LGNHFGPGLAAKLLSAVCNLNVQKLHKVGVIRVETEQLQCACAEGLNRKKKVGQAHESRRKPGNNVLEGLYHCGSWNSRYL